MADKHFLPTDAYTYISSSWNSTSWLDHCLLSSEAFESVLDIHVLYDYISSDHKPLSLSVQNLCPITTDDKTPDGVNNARKNHDLGKISHLTWEKYTRITDYHLRNIHLPIEALLCKDMNCCNKLHTSALNYCYDDIIMSLTKSCEVLSPTNNRSTHSRYSSIPGWNSVVKESHQTARNAFKLWNNYGKPRTGSTLSLMRKSRALFKYSLRSCMRHEQQKKANAIADKFMTTGSSKTFWKDIRKASNSKPCLPTCVDGTTGEANIAEMWRKHYNDLFNSVQPKDFDSSLFQDMQYISSYAITKPEVEKYINKLPNAKSAGIDNLAAEHLKYCSSRLHIILSMFFSALLVHGFLPSKMIRTILVPVMKNKCGKLSSKSNFRPIGLSSVFSKLFEYILVARMESYLVTTDNQFGFKQNHATDMCIFVLKETIQQYKTKGSSVFVTFLDASKAFDRVNHGTLFQCLRKCNVPLYILRVLYYWYTEQLFSVKWGSTLSTSFSTCNGVRQGGILSPLLFNVYVNRLSTSLNKLSVGCLFNGNIINHLMYADDIALLSPSVKGLQTLVNTCCNFGAANDIIFNESKTVCMYLLNKSDEKCCIDFPSVYMNGKVIEKVKKFKYLGHYITESLGDDEDIKKQTQLNYARANMLSRTFQRCSNDVKCLLFRTFLYSQYCCCLWSSFSRSTYSKFLVSYNNSFRILMNYPFYCSASQMFVENRTMTYREIMRLNCASFLNRVVYSNNKLISNYCFSYTKKNSKLLDKWNNMLYPT